ncbi:MAG: ABC transporter ATP-binding protein [Candidatus Sumerlaeaceae bacterium]|nr:ABC transporter ATP-binding protein [Candidatus Sumerlaeaceae bacterium]
MIVIQTEKLSKIYSHDFIDVEYGRIKFNWFRRTVALENLDLEVKEGEIFGLLGPNGAGKSTTIKILMGILFASSGSAKIMGRPLGDKSVKQQIGFLPENPFFYDYLKGEEFLDYYGQLYGLPKSVRRKRIPELFETVGLPAHAPNLPLKGYSKGMLQRIGVAQAIISDPKIVVLDEPQSGLDPLGRKEIRDIILSLKESGKTVFFSSHILSDAELICDRVAIVNRGRLTAMGELGHLLSPKVKEYEVIASGLSKETVENVRRNAVKFIERENDVLVILPEESQARELLAKIVQEKATLVSLTPRKETLEEYFIREVSKAPGESKTAGVAGVR